MTQVLQRSDEATAALHLLEQLNSGNVQHDAQPTGAVSLVLGQDHNWSMFRGRLDLSHPVVAGHSFGGATALTCVARSSDFAAAIIVDGWMLPVHRDHIEAIRTSSTPLLFVNAGEWQWTHNVRTMRQMVDGGHANTAVITILGAQHTSFADISHVMPEWLARRRNMRGSIDPSLCDRMFIEAACDFIENRDTVGLSSTCFDKFADNWVRGWGPRDLNTLDTEAKVWKGLTAAECQQTDGKTADATHANGAAKL